MRYTRNLTWLMIFLFFLSPACSESSSESNGTGGSGGKGGATQGGGSGGGIPGSGGNATGGNRATGGGIGHGGAVSSGGSISSGGIKGTGSTSSAGGMTSNGGNTGGNIGSGGLTGTGGKRLDGGVGSGGTATDGGKSDGNVNPTGGTASTDGSTGAGGSTHTGKWQVMPLGDSITGTTCYPKLLSKELIDKGHSNFTFVGTVLNNQDCGNNVANVQTEGHGGYLVTYLVDDSHKSENKGTLTELKSWAAAKPEVVLMEYGTNDCWNSGIPIANILSAYGLVVDQFRAQNPNVIFFVAQITAMKPTSSCSDCETRVEELNKQIPQWASGKSTTASPVHVVNVWSAFPYASINSYTKDGVHPNTAGSQLMADVWHDGLVAQGIP
jgi:lysophospholipase L1-like esterase